MKICQLCAVDFTLYHFILPLMRAEAAAGHDVVAVCSDGKWLEKVRKEGFRTSPVTISRSVNIFRHFGAYRQLVKLFRRERFDMVHVHTPVAALVGRLAARRAGVQCIVYTAHGFYFHERMAAWKRMLFVMLEWLAGRFTHVLFTQAKEDAVTARRFSLCAGGVIEAIGNGVDPARFVRPHNVEEHRASVRAGIGSATDAVVVIMVGRLVAEKGYPELFAAMRGLDVELWAVGDRLESDHAGAVNVPDDASNVFYLGHREDVPALLAAADIFVLPSHREGMPRSIIEAMFAGLSVIATDIRGSREEVVDGETGRLVPVANADALRIAISDLANDTIERQRMGAAGYARAAALYDEALVIKRQLVRLGLSSDGPADVRGLP